MLVASQAFGEGQMTSIQELNCAAVQGGNPTAAKLAGK